MTMLDIGSFIVACSFLAWATRARFAAKRRQFNLNDFREQ